MNISNSIGPASTFGQLSTNKVSNNPNTPIKESAHSADANKLKKEQSSNTQAPSNIVIDEQAIALFKENQATQPSLTQQNNEQTSFAQQSKAAPNNETAVASYNSVNNLAQRESIQKLFGVDLFA